MEQHSGNISELADRTITIRPRLPGYENEFRRFCRLLRRLMDAVDESGRHEALEEVRRDIEASGSPAQGKGEVAFKFTCSVIVDLVAQGWEISVRPTGIKLRSPRVERASSGEMKRRVREGHLLERDAQLRETPVREFIKGMEQRRLGPSGWVSIFSLMRDGRGLAQELESTASESDEGKRLARLGDIISPYLQAVEPSALCKFTGLKLTEIWRYFRHTWVSTYKSLPGRGMMLLVRDAAAPNHPVIGIAALGSSMAQQKLRDRWIGWDSEVFEDSMTVRPTARLARWVLESVERLRVRSSRALRTRCHPRNTVGGRSHELCKKLSARLR